MRTLISTALMSLATMCAWSADVSMPVPGATDAAGRKVLTFIAKDPPGVRCNGNLQIAAELANTYRVPIQLVPSSLVPHLPAPAVFYGNRMLAADGSAYNGAVSFQIVADVLDMEDVPKQSKEGLLLTPGVRLNFDALKSAIKAGNK